MVVNGSAGEKYNLDKKRAYVCRTYTEYPIMGSKSYIARIFDKGQRKPAIEAQVKEAVMQGTYYDDERPLNTLYIRNKFVGFLYQGEIKTAVIPDNTMENDYSVETQENNKTSNENKLLSLGIQFVMAVVSVLIGLYLIYPSYESSMDNNWAAFSEIVRKIAMWNYNGIPAVAVGFIMQIIAVLKRKEQFGNFVVSGLRGLIGNLLGVIIYTLIIAALVFLVHGAITFLMKYMVTIIIIVAIFTWLKWKFSRKG